MNLKAFVKKDISKLSSFVSNPKVVSGAITILGLASLGLSSVKEKNDRNAIKSEIMNEMGDELMDKALSKAMKQLSESNKES